MDFHFYWSQPRDIYDWLVFGCSVALAIVGVGGVIVAVVTLRNIERQTAAAEKQAAIQREMLRPRLSVTDFTHNTFKKALAGDWVFVKMEISNSGGMPAYGVVVDTWIEFAVGERPSRISPSARYRQTTGLNIHNGKPSGFFIPLHRKLTDVERNQMAKAKAAILFRVRMTYRSFGDEVHTDEAFIVRPDEMQAIPEYASAT